MTYAYGGYGLDRPPHGGPNMHHPRMPGPPMDGPYGARMPPMGYPMPPPPYGPGGQRMPGGMPPPPMAGGPPPFQPHMSGGMGTEQVSNVE